MARVVYSATFQVIYSTIVGVGLNPTSDIPIRLLKFLRQTESKVVPTTSQDGRVV